MSALLAFEAPPGTTDFTGGAAIFGNDFSSAVAGTIDGVWYYHTNSNEGANVTVQAHLTGDQSLLALKASATSGMTDNTHNYVPFDTPITYDTPDELVTLSIFYPNGMGFSFTDGLNDTTVGDLTVVRTTARFRVSGAASGGFPTSNDTTVGFAVGIEFTPDAGATIEGIAAAAIGFTAAGTGLRRVNGSAGATLAGITAAGVGKRRINGLASAALGGISGTGAGDRTVKGGGTAVIGFSAAGAGHRTTYGSAQAPLAGVVAEATNIPVVAESPGSWGQLVSILREAENDRRQRESIPPTACPNDGEPLRSAKDGSLYCPFDSWRWPRDRGTEIR